MADVGAGTTAHPSLAPRTLRAAAVLALVLAACQREEVRHFRVPREAPVPAAADLGAAAPAPATPAAGGLRWKLPAGWTEAPGGAPMRYATLKAPVAGKLDVSVVRLPGPAGGELANVNRWRNQLGLPPLAEADLGTSRKVVSTAAGALNVYDFTSGEKKSRTIAGFAEIQGESWFVKMTGDAAAVATARAPFLDLLGSIRLDAR